MLHKFVSIKNVGRFVNCAASGDVEFRGLTLMFSGNGQGKTTLCAIIRSLQTGDDSYVLERKTRGQPDDPVVHIRIDGANATLGQNGWSTTASNIAIYDSEFIHENIYAGECVDHEHKKRLHHIMVGQEGVILARKVDGLDEQSREIAKDIRSKKKSVQAFLPAGVRFDDFISLKPQSGIDEAITAKTADVDALQRATDIKKKQALQRIELPRLPDEFQPCLSKQLDNISADVERRVQDHIQSHTNSASATWLAQGVEFSEADDCPFCGQSTERIEIVKAYRAMFGQKYSDLKREIGDLQSMIERLLGEAAQLRADKTGTNEGLREFWNRFVSVELPKLDYGQDIRVVLNELYVAAKGVLKQKAAAPLEAIGPSDDFREIQTRYAYAVSKVDSYNRAIDVANALIEQQKAASEAGNVDVEMKALQMLKATRARHEPDAVRACDEYSEAERRKTQLEVDKKKAKDGLDKYSATIFGQYKKRINELLERFGADFKIGNLTPSYVGGRPSTSYPVVINDDHIDVGDIKTPRGTPSFRSTLSAGDRSSLALAFFIAQLEKRSLSDTIVVFDDPFTSQDRSRRTCTQQLICQKAIDAKQVVVMSHDPHFLKLIWDNCPRSTAIHTLQLARMGANGSTIAEWDIEKETRNSYLQEIHDLKEFVSGDTRADLRSIARKIRPVLEGHLRLRIPHQFLDREWLGDFIRKIREADSTSPLHSWQGTALGDLTDINDYSKKYHHEQNPTGADTEPIDDGELRAYVQRTLAFVGSI